MRRRTAAPGRATRALALTLALAAAARASADEPGGVSTTYSREVVRIFERKCVACHRRGDDIPLETYVDARPWALAIREEVLERHMPPWPAAHGVRPLANDLSLTPRDIAAIVSWADGGAPRGNVADMPSREPALRWAHGEPSLVLRVPAVSAATGAPRRRVDVSTRLTSERWLRGFDLAVGERGRVRTAHLFLRGSGAAAEQWLGGWTPWHAMVRAPEGVAYRLPPAATLVLELDPPAAESSEGPEAGLELGLYFEEAAPRAPGRTIEVSTAAAGPAERRRGEVVLAEDTAVWAIWPRRDAGGPLEVAALGADGARQPLLWLTAPSSGWATPYVLREPVSLRAGARLVVTALSGATAGPQAGASVVLAGYSGAVPASGGISPAGAPRR